MKNVFKKIFSIFIIAISVVAALLFAAHNQPFWLLFGLATILLIFGLFVLRTTVKSEHQMAIKKNNKNLSIDSALNDAAIKIQKMISSFENETTSNYLEQLHDIKLTGYLRFTENSTFLIEKYGMKTYADLMIPFALSERLLNRSISAAIDNNLNESFQALKDCYGHLKDVIEIEDIKTKRTG